MRYVVYVVCGGRSGWLILRDGGVIGIVRESLSGVLMKGHGCGRVLWEAVVYEAG